MQREINIAFKVSPFLVMYLVHSVQVGIGVLGFQQSLVKKAGNDSWMAVIIAGVLVHFIIWIIYKLLDKAQMDLMDIHKSIFGKWLGGVLSSIWIVYYILFSMVVLFSYFEIIRVWMFPDISVFWMVLVFLVLIFYTVLGGFRIVTGVCFFGVTIPGYLFLTFLFPLPYGEFLSLLPIWNHSILEILDGGREMSFSFLGFSTLLFYYPYIKDAPKSQKWAHLGAISTTIIYLFIILISLSYFSEGQISKQKWATLTLWKIAEMPIAERFEYIGITSWTLIILPNVCLAFWAASRGIKKVFNIRQKLAVYILGLILILSSFYFKGSKEVEFLSKVTSRIGMFTDFIYIPILFIIYIFFSMYRRRSVK